MKKCLALILIVLVLAVGCGSEPDNKSQADKPGQPESVSQVALVHRFSALMSQIGNPADVMIRNLGEKVLDRDAGRETTENLVAYAIDTAEECRTLVHIIDAAPIPEGTRPDVADMCKQAAWQFKQGYTKTADGIDMLIEGVQTESGEANRSFKEHWQSARQHFSNAAHCLENALKKARQP